MPYLQQTRDLTKQYLSYGRALSDYRPLGNTTYLPGMVCQLVTQDLQVYPDAGTVQPTAIAAGQANILGVVSEMWPGFSGAGLPTTFLSPGSAAAIRGTTGVLLCVQGYHPSVLVDCSGTGAVTITNGVLLIPSRATIGYAQGTAAVPTVNMGIVGGAVLPASGIGSSLTAPVALVQAAQTATVTTPAAGDTLNLTIQNQYNTTAPGVAQTTTYSLLLTPTTAASVTTAAAAMSVFLNAQAGFAQYFTATAAAGVVTVTVNALSNPFLVTFGSGNTVTNQFQIGVSGMVANSLTFAASVTGIGGTGFAAGGGTFAGGTGYKGTIPVFVDGATV